MVVVVIVVVVVVVVVVVAMVAALCAVEGANVGSVNAKSSSRYDVIRETLPK